MAFAFAISCLAILLLVQNVVAGSDLFPSLSPLLPPAFRDVCRQVECGKGTCKPSNSGSSLFECECEAGWRQASSLNDSHFKFLPCVIPNCTMDYSCQKAPSPAPDRASRANESIFDPCSWIDCMGGSCNKKSTFSYGCSCAEGYYNLLNISSLPCYKECAIGMNCRSLGIGLTNTSNPPAPVLSESGNNEVSFAACSIHMGNIHWMVLLMILLGVIW